MDGLVLHQRVVSMGLMRGRDVNARDVGRRRALHHAGLLSLSPRPLRRDP